MRNESSQITSASLRVFREKEFWIALGLAVFYCRRALFFEESFFFRDVYLYFLPQARLFAAYISCQSIANLGRSARCVPRIRPEQYRGLP